MSATGGKLPFDLADCWLTVLPMTGQVFLWIGVGCVISLALDWAMYERLGTSLETFWPRLAGQFPYRRSMLLRKIAIVAAGALITVAAMNNNTALITAGCVVWFVLHCAIYLEWIAASRSQQRRKA